MNITGEGGKGSARRKGANDQAYKDNYDAIFGKKECEGCKEQGMYPSHNGSAMCQSGSIASGGKKAHCTCDACF